MLKIGVVMLLLSMELFLAALNSPRAYNWVPATAPLELKKDTPTQLSFVADGDHEYDIELSFERTIDFDSLDSTLTKVKDNADFAIQVDENGKQLALGGYSSMSYSDTISVVPASFQASRGQHYSVTVTPKKSFPNLEATNAKAQISVSSIEYKDNLVNGFICTAYAAVFFLSGLIFIFLGWWRRRKVFIRMH